MPFASWSEWKFSKSRRPRRPSPCRRRLWLECLEDRTAPTGSTFASATPLAFSTLQSAQGSYYLGVSSSGNSAYDPNTGGGANGGATTGLYALDVHRTAHVPLQADLVG